MQYCFLNIFKVEWGRCGLNPAKGWCFARPWAALGRAKAPLCSALAGTKVGVGITCHNMVSPRLSHVCLQPR